MNVYTEFSNVNEPLRKHIFDQFCDYTSISGFRFLHSRHPFWFRIISAVILFGSISMFLYHSSIYVGKFSSVENRLQLSTVKAASLTVPYVVICPVREFKSLLLQNFSGDALRIINQDFVFPNTFPQRDNERLDVFLSRIMSQIENLNVSVTSYQEYEDTLAHVHKDLLKASINDAASLIDIQMALTLRNESFQQYNNFSCYYQVKQQNDTCLHVLSKKKKISQPALLSFMECRRNALLILLQTTINDLKNFVKRSANSHRPFNETIIYCKWLKGEDCTISEVRSDIGVICAKIGGKINPITANYILLKNSIRILMDTHFFDNQAGEWFDRELRIFLILHNTSNICTSLNPFAMTSGRHLDLNVIHVRENTIDRNNCVEKNVNLSVEDERKTHCLRSFCRQMTKYEVDYGFSQVQLFGGEQITERYINEKNAQYRMLNKRLNRVSNEAFLHKTFSDFSTIMDYFFDGHKVLLFMFNNTMENLLNDSLTKTNYYKEDCYAVKSFEQLVDSILQEIVNYWSNERLANGIDVTNLPSILYHRQKILASSLVRYYTTIQNFDNFSKYITTLQRKLVDLSSELIIERDKLNVKCLKLSNELHIFLTEHPLVRPLNYSPHTSIILHKLLLALKTRAATSQFGDYVKNNFASISVKFRSMTLLRVEESYQYNNFNLLVDMGSTLGLYFGMTILTLFELVIFVFYRNASDPFQIKTAPSAVVIYGLPMHRRRGKWRSRFTQQEQPIPPITIQEVGPLLRIS